MTVTPAAWVYELATSRRLDGVYSNWDARLSVTEPNVPSGSIRHLTALYAAAPLADMIDRAIELKQGNKEFMLSYDPCHNWRAEIGNPSKWVRIGEVDGDIDGEGASPEEAMAALIVKLEALL